MPPESVMVFCAGFGTRMGSLVSDRPKPLIEVAGRSLLDRTLDLVGGAGIPTVVANTHYMGDKIRAHLADRPVHLSHETPDILDTGGGLKAALPILGTGPVFTANSDTIMFGSNPFLSLAKAWRPKEMGALLLVVPVERCLGRAKGGDFSLGENGHLSRHGDLVYSGVQILHTDRVAEVPDSVFSLNRIWDSLEKEGRLFGTVWHGDWIDVGNPEGLAIAERIVGGDTRD